jgi:hypothetical protein
MDKGQVIISGENNEITISDGVTAFNKVIPPGIYRGKFMVCDQDNAGKVTLYYIDENGKKVKLPSEAEYNYKQSLIKQDLNLDQIDNLMEIWRLHHG